MLLAILIFNISRTSSFVYFGLINVFLPRHSHNLVKAQLAICQYQSLSRQAIKTAKEFKEICYLRNNYSSDNECTFCGVLLLVALVRDGTCTPPLHYAWKVQTCPGDKEDVNGLPAAFLKAVLLSLPLNSFSAHAHRCMQTGMHTIFHKSETMP